jgi:polyhydroxyalkanoate synthesis regulator phasin
LLRSGAAAGLFAFDGVAKRPDNPRVILLELATQGIRGAVSASGRATFRPGYVVVPAGGDAFCATLGALLWCDATEGEGLRAAAGHAVRAGATFTAGDRTLYRLVTDFASEFQLQRYDGGTRTFSPAAAGRAAVTEWMRAQVGVASREALEDLLWICAGRLPSRLAEQARVSAPPTPLAAPEPDRIRARLAELRENLERSQAVDQLQGRVDELQSRLFKLEDALREGARLGSELELAEAQLESLAPLAEAADQLGDVEARFAAHERATARRDEALSRISQERESLAEAAVAPPPLWRLPELWAGIAAGVVALSAGIASRGALRYVALLDVPAFGWSAWTALRWVGRLEAEERAGKRTRVVDERDKKVREQWEIDAGPIRRAMAAAGVTETAELRKALDSVAGARAARQAAADAIAAWQEGAETQDAQREHAQVEAELKDADAALSALAMGHYVRDVDTLEAEIARLEAELASGEQPSRPASAPAGSGDVLAELVRRAAAQIGPEEDEALARVGTRASEILAVIAGRRLEAPWGDPDGAIVVQPAGGRVRFSELPPEARDLCWIALKLALLEHALPRGSAFAVVDSALDGLPLAVRRVAAHILKRAARSGQVLHATADPVFREAADHVA